MRRTHTSVVTAVVAVVALGTGIGTGCGASSPPEAAPATAPLATTGGGAAARSDDRAALRTSARARTTGNVLAVVADPPNAAVLWRDPTGRDRLSVYPGDGPATEGYTSTQPSGGVGPTTGPVASADRTDAELAVNRELVRRFYRDVLDEGRADTVDTYVVADYIQHNPAVPQGIEGIRALAQMLGANPSHGANRSEELLLADGDLVVLVNVIESAGSTPPSRLVDMFRIPGGKIAEHWDFTLVAAPSP